MQLFNQVRNILFITTCLISWLVVAEGANNDETFKINKLKLIWNKAQHSLGPSKLKDLRNELLTHESDELNLKKMKAHNQDKDGLFEATIRKKLLAILTKYSLDRYFEDILGSSDKKVEPNVEGGKPNRVFRESKLDKLWKKAEKSGFTQEQLMVLQEEFQHQQDKLDEHYDIMNMLEEEIDKRSKKAEVSENSLESDIEVKKKSSKSKKNKESKADKKARLDENIHQTLKEKHSEIKSNYDKLQSKINTGALDETRPFEEEAVNDLWSTALESNFSSEELSSLKEELGHFEIRIKKLKHFQNQLERGNIIHSKDSDSYGEEDKETKHIRKKVEELDRKVSKAHETFEKRIQTKREEL